MSEIDTSDPMARWRDLVGGFILAFGDIELLTHRLWQEVVGTQPPPVFFKERTRKLLGYLRKDEEKNKEIIGALVEALRIADKRNTVAHNPMHVQVFQHTETGQLLIEQAISSATSDDYIDDLELIELRAAAEDLVARLYIAMGFIDPRESANKTMEPTR
jgi:hypothetical protein